MLHTIKRSFRLIIGIAQNAHRSPQTGEMVQARVISDQGRLALEHLEWMEEQAYWESKRQARQLVIEIAELEAESARLTAESQRQDVERLRRERAAWSRRMHAAKAAKKKA